MTARLHCFQTNFLVSAREKNVRAASNELGERVACKVASTPQRRSDSSTRATLTVEAERTESSHGQSESARIGRIVRTCRWNARGSGARIHSHGVTCGRA